MHNKHTKEEYTVWNHMRFDHVEVRNLDIL